MNKLISRVGKSCRVIRSLHRAGPCLKIRHTANNSYNFMFFLYDHWCNTHACFCVLTSLYYILITCIYSVSITISMNGAKDTCNVKLETCVLHSCFRIIVWFDKLSITTCFIFIQFAFDCHFNGYNSVYHVKDYNQ